MPDPAASPLFHLSILTKLGATYEFPDVTPSGLAILLGQLHEGNSNPTLSNVSGAVLVIPRRIIQRIDVNGESWWKSLA